MEVSIGDVVRYKGSNAIYTAVIVVKQPDLIVGNLILEGSLNGTSTQICEEDIVEVVARGESNE